MSALGQKRTLEQALGMSALPPKADIGRHAKILMHRPQLRRRQRARHHAPSRLFDATGLDAAVLEDGRDIGLPGLAAGDRAEDHERRDHESCASNE
jgi:hypothetical protein